MQKKIKFITTAAIIAAAYVVLTFLSAALNIAYGPIQFRISEALCILPIFTPAAIYGLTVGCLISNILSFNVLDMIFGTLATFVAAVLTYYTRNVRSKGLPLLSAVFPVILNAVVVGAEISFFFLNDTAFFTGFIISALQVGFGEIVVCFGIGIPFFTVLKKIKISWT